MRVSKHSPLLAVAVIVALLAGLPVASVGLNIFVGGTSATWSHLAATVLPEYILNSLWLCLGVGVGVGTLGVTTAWLTAMHDVPGRRFFEWALVLPLAMPAYVMAYVYTDFLQFVGPLQTALREAFGWQHGDYWFPDIRSLPGAILMFVCVLYPYVYLLVRTAFLERASGMLEAARTLGRSQWGAFFRVALPLARPAIAVGVTVADRVKAAEVGSTTRHAPERSRSFWRTFVRAGPSAPEIGDMATSTLRVCSITMTGAADCAERRQGESRRRERRSRTATTTRTLKRARTIKRAMRAVARCGTLRSTHRILVL